MKKIFAFALVAMATVAANAQYVSTVKGTVLKYDQTFQAEGQEQTLEQVRTIVEVNTDDKGVVTVVAEDVTPIPGTVMGTSTTRSNIVFNPADTTTTFLISGKEEAKQNIIDMIVAASGGAITPEQANGLGEYIDVKGELTLAVSPNVTKDAKYKNQTQTVKMKTPEGSQTLKFNLWEVKIYGIESITVPAGTYDCLKLSYLYRTSAGGQTQKLYITEWHAEGIGEVRSEMATSKGGDPDGVSVLKSIVAPN